MALTQAKLLTLKNALIELEDKVYHYGAPNKEAPSYIVWMEDGAESISGDNGHAEDAWTGSVDLYTKTEFDPLMDQIPAAIEAVGGSWTLNAVQFETETGLIHYEWTFVLG